MKMIFSVILFSFLSLSAHADSNKDIFSKEKIVKECSEILAFNLNIEIKENLTHEAVFNLLIDCQNFLVTDSDVKAVQKAIDLYIIDLSI
jgi:hypothetical protein